MTDFLVTTRLRGVPLTEDDFDELYALHQDEQVVAAFGADPANAEETRKWLARNLAHWREHGFGVWMFRDGRDVFVGRSSIRRWSLDGRDEVELGYIVRSSLWSQGYATEMASAVVHHAFSPLGLRELVAFTRPDNVRSRRVMEKLGFVYERNFVDDEGESVLYRLRGAAVPQER